MAKKTARKKATNAGGRKTVARKAAGRKASPKKTTKRAASASSRKAAKPAPRGIRVPRGIRRVPRGAPSVSMADVRGAEVRRDVGGVRLEAGRAGQGRVKRMIYPPGYKWSTDTKPHVGTDFCMHAHVGFLVQGRIDVIYADGCVEVFEAPQIVAVAPGHDGHVVGSESAVLIEFDFENDTVQRFGMPDAHRHE